MMTGRIFRLELLMAVGLIFGCVLELQGATKKSASIFKRVKSRSASMDEFNYGSRESFLLVESESGSGSAFLTRLFDTPLIVTNAHVYLTMKNPVVKDMNNQIYKITDILVSKTRDLVLLNFENSSGKLPALLNTVANLDDIWINSSVQAFGNALGDGVISSCEGKLLAVGPEKIEIDAEIVPGNSGGPVFAAGSNQVIGVSTYLRYVEMNKSLKGSKFDAEKVGVVVRRFATRIDNLSPDDFENPDKAKLNDDIDKLADMEKLMREIFAGIESETPVEGLHRKLRKNQKTLNGMRNYPWQTSYMRKSCDENLKLLAEIQELLADIFPFDKILDDHLAEFKLKKIKELSCRCFICAGRGTIHEYDLTDKGSASRLGENTVVTQLTCPGCSGYKRRIFKEPFWRIEFAPGLLKLMQEKIVSDTENSFASFNLGMSYAGVLAKFPHYRFRSNLLGRYPLNCGEAFIFRSSHFSRNIDATVLKFQCGKLVEVTLIIGGKIDSNSNPENLIRPLLLGKNPPQVEYVEFKTKAETPFNINGNPLSNDFQGLVVTAYHPMAKPLKQLDFIEFAL